MSGFENATAFFHACEGLQGCEGCRQYVVDSATFDAQSEPLVEVRSVEDYCEWMAGLGKGPLEGCSYDLHASAWDDDSRCAIFFATFNGIHAGAGGPVEPTGKATRSHYVYVLQMDADDKVAHMTKVWNAPWALAELGWA